MSDQLDQAIQQLTGMHYSEGRNVYAVCEGMGLLPEEWDEIKQDCSWLSEYEIGEIEDYLRGGETGNLTPSNPHIE